MEEIESNTHEMPRFGDLTNLSPEKLQGLETVLTSILALPVARETYAQIIHGTPTRTPYSEDIKAHRSPFLETIVTTDDSKPSDQAMQLYEEIRAAFAPQTLRIDLKARICSLIIPCRKLILPDLTRHSWPKIIKMRYRVAVNTGYAFWR